MDYQIEQLAKSGYHKMEEALDFLKVTEHSEAMISVEWSYNPDKVMYSAVVKAFRDGKQVATWFSEKTFKFHTILRETEEMVRFIGDLMKEER